MNAVAWVDQHSHVFMSGSDDGTVKIWDRRIGEGSSCVKVFTSHNNGITFLDSRRDGRYIISNSKDHSIKLWDLRSGGADFEEDHLEYGKVTLGYRQRPNYREGTQEVATFAGHQTTQTLIRCRFSPEHWTGQRYIYTGSADGNIYGR